MANQMGDSSCIIRNFRIDDFSQYLDLHIETERADRSGRFLTQGVLAESLKRPNYSPEQDLFLAESRGKIIGFCDLTPELVVGRVLLDFLVHPEHRRKGVATKLIQHALESSKEYGVDVAHVDVPETNLSAQHMLSHLGFRFIRRFFEMERALDEISPADTAPGLTSRSLEEGEEHKLTKLQNRFFADTWGFNPNTIEEIIYCINTSGCSPEDVILLCRDGRPVGYCWTKIDAKKNAALGVNKGRIHMMGIDPDLRGKGLGKALLHAGLSYLKKKEIEITELTVDSQNSPACALYKSFGFEIRSVTLWYEKTLG